MTGSELRLATASAGDRDKKRMVVTTSARMGSPSLERTTARVNPKSRPWLLGPCNDARIRCSIGCGIPPHRCAGRSAFPVFRPAAVSALVMAQKLPYREYRARGPRQIEHVTWAAFRQPRTEPMSQSFLDPRIRSCLTTPARTSRRTVIVVTIHERSCHWEGDVTSDDAKPHAPEAVTCSVRRAGRQPDLCRAESVGPKPCSDSIAESRPGSTNGGAKASLLAT